MVFVLSLCDLDTIDLVGWWCVGVVFFPCFFFNDSATTEIYTLSLHDALPISVGGEGGGPGRGPCARGRDGRRRPRAQDRKSTRLNSSHVEISYAVFCLKKKKN